MVGVGGEDTAESRTRAIRPRKIGWINTCKVGITTIIPNEVDKKV